MTPSESIPTFQEINDLHSATGYAGRTDLPSFHVFALDRGCETVRAVMPPHRRGFYQATLLRTAVGVSVAVDTARRAADQDLLVFAAPRQVISWTKSEAQSGWVVYFKADFMSLTDSQIERQFRFFQPGEVNVQILSDVLTERLRGYCEQMCSSFGACQSYRPQVLRGLFTAFLFECLSLYTAAAAAGSGKSAEEAILWRFRHLLDRYFLTYRTVTDYAKLMRITPGHLTEAVRLGGGQSASKLIARRLLYEAEQLLLHSELTIADVSTHLQFSEPAHFTRFFKRLSGRTPREFRESGHSVRDWG